MGKHSLEDPAWKTGRFALGWREYTYMFRGKDTLTPTILFRTEILSRMAFLKRMERDGYVDIKDFKCTTGWEGEIGEFIHTSTAWLTKSNKDRS